MGPYGTPAGTVGARGMDLGPYFQGWQLRNQAWQQEQARRQAAEQFARQAAFDETALASREKLAGLDLEERKAGREQQRDLAELDVREGRADREAANQRQRTELAAREAEKSARWEREDKWRAEDLRLREEDIARDAAAAKAKTERDEAAKAEQAQGRTDTATGLVEAGNLWETARSHFEGLRRGRWGANEFQGADARTILDSIANAARINARRKFADNPAALGTALDEIDRTYQRELESVEARETAAESKRKADLLDAEQRRKEADSEANRTMDEQKLAQREEQDRRESLWEQRQDEVSTLLAEAQQLRELGDVEGAREVLARLRELRNTPLE